MKKLLIALSIFATLTILGCTELMKIKITRTATTKIPLTYSINKMGDFSESSIINTDDIINRFDFNDRFYYNNGQIEKFEVHSVAIGANLGAGNTAKQVQLTANMTSAGSLTTILNDTKVITLVSDSKVDFLSGLGNVIGVDKNNITLNNAISLLNAGGAKALEKAMVEALDYKKQVSLSINVNGKVPSNQRMVMTLSILIEASLTYSKCEDTLGLIGSDSECKN